MTTTLPATEVTQATLMQRVRALISHAAPQDGLLLESLAVHIHLLLQNGPKKFNEHRLKAKLKHSLSAKYLGLLHSKTIVPTERGSICFYADHPGQIQQQLPVYHALVQNGIPCDFLVHKVTLFKLLKKEGISSVLIPVSYFRIQQPLSKDWALSIQQQAGFNWLTPSLIQQIEALSLANYMLPTLMDFVQDWIGRRKPKAFVVGYDLNPACRATTLVFKKSGLPCFCIQHGIIYSDSQLPKYHIVDHFLVFGAVTKTSMEAENLPFKAHVTGAPYLKPAIDKANQQADRVRSLLPGHAFEKMILVAFSGHGHSTSKQHLHQQVLAVAELAKAHPSLGFTFKLHPKDSKANYVEVNDLPNCFVVQNSDFAPPAPEIFDWLERSNAIITGASTVAMEALIMGKPVFTIDFMGEYAGMDFIQAGATLHTTDLLGFSQMFTEWVGKPSNFTAAYQRGQRFIETFYAHKDDAAERCAEVILQYSRTEQNN